MSTPLSMIQCNYLIYIYCFRKFYSRSQFLFEVEHGLSDDINVDNSGQLATKTTRPKRPLPPFRELSAIFIKFVIVVCKLI